MKRETRIGITVIAGLLGLYLFIAWAKSIHLFSVARKSYSLHFSDIGGLKTGDPVMVRGYPAGVVMAIHPEAEWVQVQIALDPDVKVFSDAAAEIRMKELMGGKMILLEPGKSGEVWNEKQIMPGRLGADFPSTFSRFGSLAESIDPRNMDSLVMHMNEVASAFSALAKNLEASKMDDLFGKASQSAERMDRILMQAERSRLFTRVDSVLTAFERMRPDLQRTVSAASGISQKLDGDYLDKTEKMMEELEQTLSSTQTSLSEMNVFLKKMNDTRNVAGKMMNDPEFAKQMETAIRNLNAAMETVNRDRLTIGMRILKNKKP